MEAAGFIGRFFKKPAAITAKLDNSNLPVHVAIIPDGNGRWAQKRGMPRNVGHREGSRVIKEITRYCAQLGIKYLTIYAFSTENWKRSEDEVQTLMGMLLDFLKNAEKELQGSDVRIKVIGAIEGLSQEFQREIKRVEALTLKNQGLNLQIALNYGGRDEIINAVRDIAYDIRKGSINPEGIDSSLFSKYLYTKDIPDPDLLIRTGAEKRISNFLLWQLAYTEMLFIDVLWPDFNKDHFIDAITRFAFRKRRFGGI